MEAHELEALLDKVGGKYKLVTLFQKRMRELQRGLPRLVTVESGNVWEVVGKEILESKVDLIIGEEADQIRREQASREAEETADAEKKGKKPGLEKPAEAPAAG
jgi:DNA-directed RNA polymerase subunit omega